MWLPGYAADLPEVVAPGLAGPGGHQSGLAGPGGHQSGLAGPGGHQSGLVGPEGQQSGPGCHEQDPPTAALVG